MISSTVHLLTDRSVPLALTIRGESSSTSLGPPRATRLRGRVHNARHLAQWHKSGLEARRVEERRRRGCSCICRLRCCGCRASPVVATVGQGRRGLAAAIPLVHAAAAAPLGLACVPRLAWRMSTAATGSCCLPTAVDTGRAGASAPRITRHTREARWGCGWKRLLPRGRPGYLVSCHRSCRYRSRFGYRGWDGERASSPRLCYRGDMLQDVSAAAEAAALCAHSLIGRAHAPCASPVTSAPPRISPVRTCQQGAAAARCSARIVPPVRSDVRVAAAGRPRRTRSSHHPCSGAVASAAPPAWGPAREGGDGRGDVVGGEMMAGEMWWEGR